ncbi:MAG: carbohydrate ABC transporter permease [Spirochaetota bacterium]
MSRSYYEKLKGKNSYFTILMSVLVTMYCLIALFLIPTVVLSSFKSREELIKNIIGIPKVFTLENYYTVLFKDNFVRYFFNSILLTALSLVSLLFVASMTAYGLSRYNFKGKTFLQIFFLLGMMFPIQLGILPIFIIIRWLGLANNFLGMMLIYTANMSLPVFIFSKFFRTLPRALYESAVIDGANDFRIYAQIMIPLSKPVLATVGILNFVIIWNDFYLPLVFLTKKSVRTLTLAIYWYMNNFLANWHLVFAAVTVALIPVIAIFLLFSEQLIAGLTAGALRD